MSTALPIHAWPSSSNCLAWSSDCQLAIAITDGVEIVTPRLSPEHLAPYLTSRPFAAGFKAPTKTSNTATSAATNIASQNQAKDASALPDEPEFDRQLDAIIASTDDDINWDQLDRHLQSPAHEEPPADDSRNWDRFILQTGTFPRTAFPQTTPAPMATFSIGAEQSTSPVVALAWSPPGLARYGRCVLAVLTASLVLALYAPTGADPTEKQAWSRVLVVNDALKAWSSDDTGKKRARESSVEFDPDADGQSRKCHVRSFAWAQTLAVAGAHGGQEDVFKLSIANGDSEVVVLQVTSPFSGFPGTDETQGEWTCEVKCSTKIPEPLPALKSSSTFEHLDITDVLASSTFASAVSWSQWTLTGKDKHEAEVAFISNRRLCGARCVMSRTSIDLVSILEAPWRVSGSHEGPIHWLHHAGASTSTRPSLMTLTSDGICVVTVDSRSNATQRAKATFTNEPNIAEMVGSRESTTTRTAKTGDHILHIGPTISYTAGGHSCFAVSENSITHLPSGLFHARDVLSQHVRKFQKDNDLLTAPLVRMWGIAACPSMGFLAACYAFHPSDRLHYAIRAEQNSLLVITHADHEDIPAELRLALNQSDQVLHSEALLFAIVSYLRSYKPGTFYHDRLQSELVKAISASNASGARVIANENGNTNGIRTEMNAQQLSHTLRKQLQYSVAFASWLVSLLSENDDAMNLRQAWLRERQLHFTCNTLKLADSTDCTSLLDRKVLQFHRMVAEGISLSQDLTLSSEEKILTAENCVFCDAKIEFLDPSRSVCGSGHHFVRCGITFLTIRAPGISKFCSLCGKHFLRGYSTARQSLFSSDSPLKMTTAANAVDGGPQPASAMQGMNDDNGPPAFVQIIFAACTRCIYCGGKFVG